MLTRKWWISSAVFALLFVALVACVMISLVLYFDKPDMGITRQIFGNVHLGMAKREVEAIMGGPGVKLKSEEALEIMGGDNVHMWQNEDEPGQVYVCYNNESRVATKLSCYQPRVSFFDSLRQWLLDRLK